MSYPFGITGIANNPYMNGLGTYGLQGGGAYSSYPMMNYGLGMGMGMYPSNYGMGYMNMYPNYMAQMNQAYQDIEKYQINHAGAMHNLVLQNELDAYKNHDKTIFNKAIQDSRVHSQVRLLSDKIKDGDSNGICEEFDKLKVALYQKYADEIKANGQDPHTTVTGYIEDLYSALITKGKSTLKDDIKKYGETAFTHGFNRRFFRDSSYHDKYSEETLSYLFGTSIDSKKSKENKDKLGQGVGMVSELATTAAVGSAIGLGSGVIKNKSLKGLGKWGKIGAGIAAGLDIVWQLSRD